MIALRVIAVITSIVAFTVTALASEKFQVFFLAAGSTYYLQPSDTGLHGFGELSGANGSARLIADLMSKHGAVAGATLVSTPDHFISKGDFESGVTSVAAQIRAHRPQNPLLVVYYAGHGISEGVAWNHFSVPGNFVYGAPLERLDVQGLADHTIHAGFLADELDGLKIPYLLLLDTCYEGKSRSFQSPVLTSPAIQNLTDVAGILRFQNEFHIPNPVIFSAEPGKEVPLAADPRDPELKSLAPLARRFLLLDRQMSVSGTEMSLTSLVSALTSAGLDAETSAPVTHATRPARDDVVLARSATTSAEVLNLAATATTADACCNPNSDAATTSGGDSQRMTGSLTFEGPAGEFISNGQRVSLAHSGEFITRVQRDPQSIELTFDGSEDWELDIAAPNSETLSTKTYRSAQRYPLQDAGRPGLSLSGAARACNEIDGEFTVTRLTRDAANRITDFAAQFVQRCDGQIQPLRGTVQAHLQ